MSSPLTPICDAANRNRRLPVSMQGHGDSGATPPVRNGAQALVASGHARSTPMARNQSMSRAGATPNHPHVTRFERGYRRCCRSCGDSTATQGIQAGPCRCRPRRGDTQRFRSSSAAASVAAMVQQCTSSDSSETMVTHPKTLRSTSRSAGRLLSEHRRHHLTRHLRVVRCRLANCRRGLPCSHRISPRTRVVCPRSKARCHVLGRSDTGKKADCWAAVNAAGPGLAVICAWPVVWYSVEPPSSAMGPPEDGYCARLACCAGSPI